MIRPARSPTREDVARHYDELDRMYREVWGENLHHGLWLEPNESPEAAAENLVARVAEWAGLEARGNGTRVCDVGCGYGAPARFLAHRFGAYVTGLTLSSVQHARATASASSVTRDAGSDAQAERDRQSAAGGDDRMDVGDGRGELLFLLRDWLDNGLPADHFDVVIALESISHVEDKLQFVQEAHRTLRHGGRFVLVAWLAGDDPTLVERKLLLEPICSEGRLPGLADRWEYEEWLAEAGFRAVRFEDLSRKVRRTWTVCIGRALGRLIRDRETRRYLLDSRATERAFGLALLRIWMAYR
ncbi:MAG: class I SAM-dependent methyltransferase, partial [bacterium]